MRGTPNYLPVLFLLEQLFKSLQRHWHDFGVKVEVVLYSDRLAYFLHAFSIGAISQNEDLSKKSIVQS